MRRPDGPWPIEGQDVSSVSAVRERVQRGISPATPALPSALGTRSPTEPTTLSPATTEPALPDLPLLAAPVTPASQVPAGLPTLSGEALAADEPPGSPDDSNVAFSQKPSAPEHGPEVVQDGAPASQDSPSESVSTESFVEKLSGEKPPVEGPAVDPSVAARRAEMLAYVDRMILGSPMPIPESFLAEEPIEIPMHPARAVQSPRDAWTGTEPFPESESLFEDADGKPDFQVTIGHLEVTAPPPVVEQAPSGPERPQPRMSLEDYVAMRRAGRYS